MHQEFIYSGLPKFNENIGSRYFFGLIKNDTESPDYSENLDKVLLDMNKKYFRKSFFLMDGVFIDIIAYENLLDAKISKKKAKVVPKVTKPGTGTTKGEVNSEKVKQQRARLRKTGKVGDAAKLLEGLI